MLNKREILVLVVMLVMVGIVASVAYALSIPICAFHYLTGIPCPGCGMTRACVSLLKGDVLKAFSFNPLAVVLVFTGPFAIWMAATRRPWSLAVMTCMKAIGWIAFWVNWVYLLFRDLN